MAAIRWQSALDVLVKSILAFYALRFIRKQFLPPPSAVMGSNDQVYQSAWRTGDRFDLYVYVSDSPSLTTFLKEDLVWHQSGLEFGSYKEDQYPTADLSIRFRGRNPLDLFAHVYAVKRNVDPNTPHSVLYRRKTMAGPDWWYPELDISVVSDPEPYDLSVLHPLAVQQMALDSSTHTYTPIMYLNDFWHIKSRRVPLSGDEMPLKVTFSPLSLYKYQLLLAFDHSFQVNEALLDGEGGLGGVDSIKESLRSTQPWILFLTLAVTCLHAIFDMLAFKNDVQFWRKQEDLSGLSTRSILVNAIFQFIILLYLFEQGTSTVVLASTAIGLAIEVWKIFRVLHVAVGWSRFGLPYPVFRDRPSYKGETKDHDETAMWYLFLVATPLLIGYAIYSLIYESYKSLYSWLLSTLVGFVYAFGFIMMTPQLFINYKLKSVAHLPWRVFIYKSLNTFIDDLFSFIIKMPLLHRLACFRDDIVYLVYLYQRWIYPVDKSRVNEFGQSFEEKQRVGDGEKSAAEKEEVSKLKTDGVKQRVVSRRRAN